MTEVSKDSINSMLYCLLRGVLHQIPEWMEEELTCWLNALEENGTEEDWQCIREVIVHEFEVGSYLTEQDPKVYLNKLGEFLYSDSVSEVVNLTQFRLYREVVDVIDLFSDGGKLKRIKKLVEDLKKELSGFDIYAICDDKMSEFHYLGDPEKFIRELDQDFTRIEETLKEEEE